MNISEFIKSNRERLGMTQIDLSRLSGVSQSNISKIEAGFMGTNVKAFFKLVEALGMRIEIKKGNKK